MKPHKWWNRLTILAVMVFALLIGIPGATASTVTDSKQAAHMPALYLDTTIDLANPDIDIYATNRASMASNKPTTTTRATLPAMSIVTDNYFRGNVPALMHLKEPTGSSITISNQTTQRAYEPGATRAIAAATISNSTIGGTSAAAHRSIFR